jgi:hypothetical protein
MFHSGDGLNSVLTADAGKGAVMENMLKKGWIWHPEKKRNQYVLFHKYITTPEMVSKIWVSITASYHYELYINSEFINRGPVHGDPARQPVDTFPVSIEEEKRNLEVTVLVHHVSGTYLSYVTPAPPGLTCWIRWPGGEDLTGESWRCLDLSMWSNNSPERHHYLDYVEDYNAAEEPDGWRTGGYNPGDAPDWVAPVLITGEDNIWKGYHNRSVPFIERITRQPVRFRAWRAPGAGPENPFRISRIHDEEELLPVSPWLPWNISLFCDLQETANAFTFDYGEEYTGFYRILTGAKEGTVIEISGAELLKDEERPWIFRKGGCYSVRYRAAGGANSFRSFSWNGFRYIHTVIRRLPDRNPSLTQVSCIQRQVKLPECIVGEPKEDAVLKQIFRLCRNTLRKGVQEHLIDCPTREQTPAWADSQFTGRGIWIAFGVEGYLCQYMDMYIQAPVNENGVINARYPGTNPKSVWLDMCLIPALAEDFYCRKKGVYYRPEEFLKKALKIKVWFDEHTDSRGLVDFPFQEYWDKSLRNFIDHPGLGMHDSPHPGIDRDGTSCPLNCFFYGFIRILADMAASIGNSQSASLYRQSEELAEEIREVFYDGTVFHDTRKEDGSLSCGTSWQTNSLSVYMGLIPRDQASKALDMMVQKYSELCRCTPYFYYYLLPALRRCGEESKAYELIKQEWGVMTAAGATTTWEGFLGNNRDSLFHLWSTAPLNFFGDPDDRGLGR